LRIGSRSFSIGAWKRAHWVELSAVGFAAAYNVIFHRLLPQRAHLAANLGAAAALVVTARAAGEGWSELGLQRSHLAHGTRLGLRFAIPISAAAATAAVVPASRRVLSDERITAISRREATFETLVRIPIETALAEEVIFRGVLLGLALRTRSPRAAVLSNALLFGLWHVMPTWQATASHRGDGEERDGVYRPKTRFATVGVTALTSVAGGMLAWMRLYSGSVMTPVVAHAALNIAAFAGVHTASIRSTI
jgi:uncharacterized protein